MRGLVSPVVELEAGFSRVDVFDEEETAVNVTSRFHISEVFALAVGFTAGEDADSVSATLRFNF